MNNSEICALMLRESAEQKRRLAQTAKRRGEIDEAKRLVRGAQRLDMVADGLQRATKSVDKFADAA
jgi:hypothetical protein